MGIVLDRPKMCAHLEIRDVGDESLVHDSATNKVHVLNASAAKVLRFCDGHHDRAAISLRLSAESGAAPGLVGPDVDEILGRFRELGLLEGGRG